MTSPADQITQIEGYLLRCSMPMPAGNALRVFSERAGLLIRIRTAGGQEGWGETWAFPQAATALIQHHLAPHVLGKHITNPRAIHQAMLSVAVPDRRGQMHMALSALDMAVWDALGRSCGRSIAELLGGSLRADVMAYASGPLLPAGDDRYAGFEQAVEQFVKEGFQAVKIRVGVGFAADVRAIEAARAIVGQDATLMIDLNEASTIGDTIALAEATRSSRLAWIEEPVRHDHVTAYRKLSERLSVPLSGGESFCGVQAFRDVMVDGSLALLQPDLAICGGFTEAMKIAGLADAFDVAVSPHVWGSGINFLASLQYAAVLSGQGVNPGFPLFEYDKSHNPLRACVFDPRPDAKGRIAIPDGPGLGMPIGIEPLGDYVVDHWSVGT